jgi:D-3-phosphoglycerate dehydrogenase
VTAANDPQRTLVVVDSEFPDVSIEQRAAERWDVAVERRSASEPSQIATAVGAAAGLLVQYLRVDAATIDACPTLRVIGRYGVGVDNIDTDAAARCGVAVVNVPDYCVEEVASHALALLLAAWRKVPAADRLVREGRWGERASLEPIGALSEATLGLVGVGRIGSRLAQLATPLFGRVAAHDPFAASLPAEVEPMGLEALLAESHAISLHVPLRPETDRLMNAERLAWMRPGSILVNVSRGALVDTDALARALDGGRPAFAALDVLPTEPPATGERLLGDPRVLLTPHMAWYSTGSITRLRQSVAERSAAVLAS